MSWSFQVEEYSPPADGPAIAVLVPVSAAPYFAPSCDRIRLELSFKREPFWRRTWSKQLVTQEKHEAALQLIRSAAVAGEPLQFGVMGTGLVASPDESCSFVSKGVAELEENDGRKAVYSFHDPV